MTPHALNLTIAQCRTEKCAFQQSRRIQLRQPQYRRCLTIYPESEPVPTVLPLHTIYITQDTATPPNYRVRLVLTK